MNKLKENLVVSLGVVGIVLWYLLDVAIALTPLVFLDFPLWIKIIVLFALMSFQYVGGLIQIALWVWSFVVVIARPIDGWSIFYFVTFAFFFFVHILPSIVNIITAIVEAKQDRR